ncbi:MAG: hypothetical protein EPN20_00750 [Magnetospirillum sp.]|nr:MAG: hypothetical protein EPN20_00750 [Magnetospirillum sp.]
MNLLRRLGPALLALLVVGHAGFAAEPAARITRQTGETRVLRAGVSVPLAAGGEVFARDHLTAAAGGRLEASFADGTIVTLAGSSEVAIDSWRFTPDDNDSRLFLRLITGSVMVVAGRVAELPDQQLRLRTPVATVGVRGTRFWAGPLEGRFGVLLLEGGVYVENTSGRVDLSAAGTGVFIAAPPSTAPEDLTEPADAWIGPGAPPARGGPLSEPEAWNPERVARALDAVSF